MTLAEIKNLFSMLESPDSENTTLAIDLILAKYSEDITKSIEQMKVIETIPNGLILLVTQSCKTLIADSLLIKYTNIFITDDMSPKQIDNIILSEILNDSYEPDVEQYILEKSLTTFMAPAINDMLQKAGKNYKVIYKLNANE